MHWQKSQFAGALILKRMKRHVKTRPDQIEV